MIFTDICQGIFSVGRITPTGVTLLGTAFAINKPGYFAPVVAIILVTITKMGINAWLAMRKEKREATEKSTE